MSEPSTSWFLPPYDFLVKNKVKTNRYPPKPKPPSMQARFSARTYPLAQRTPPPKNPATWTRALCWFALRVDLLRARPGKPTCHMRVETAEKNFEKQLDIFFSLFFFLSGVNFCPRPRRLLFECCRGRISPAFEHILMLFSAVTAATFSVIKSLCSFEDI